MVWCLKGHLEVQEMAYISSERLSKTMGVHVENETNHELGALPLVEGRGAKHSPPGEICQNLKNHIS